MVRTRLERARRSRRGVLMRIYSRSHERDRHQADRTEQKSLPRLLPIEDRLEAGIALVGTEVKSLREGRANLRDSYAAVNDGELYLIGVHISPYTAGNIFNHDPMRDRKLLVHARELRKLANKVKATGYTLVPTRMYFRDGRAKVEIAVARGKAQYDKRQTLAKKDAQREIERAVKSRGRERDRGE